MMKFVIFAVAVTICSAGSSNIIRPCKIGTPETLQCIRDNIFANSQCNPNVVGSLPSVYDIRSYRYETPYFNSSYIDNNLIIRNHDKCRVVEFFFNTLTDKVVFGLECLNMGFESDRILLRHQTYLEDAVYNYHINGVYPILRLTTTISNANALDVCTSFTYTDIPVLPQFYVNPYDSPTSNFLSQDLSELFIYERETFAYRGQELFKYFVRNLICDFGCNIY